LVARAAAGRRRAVAAAAAIAAFGLLLQASTHLNQDIAWIIYSAAQMLDGAVFGRDIIEPNPPLAWLLAMPAAAAWRFQDLAPDQTWRLMVAALAGGVVGHAYGRLRDLRDPGAGRDGDVIAIVLAYYFFVGCYRDYGQREYLCLALALPYLVLAVARAEGAPVRWTAAIAVGAAAGVGFALKPYFLAVPLLVEAALLLRTRRPLQALRGETVALAAVVAAYGAGVLLLTPSYVNEVVPLVGRIYWAFESSFAMVVLPAIIEMLGLAAALYLYAKGSRSSLQLVLLAAALGFLLSYFLQAKGYSYHLFPVRALVGASLVLHLVALLRSPRHPRRRALVAAGAGAALVFIANAVYLTIWYSESNRAFGSAAAVTDDIVRLADRHAPGGTFLALATHPFPAFPTALYSEAKWGSRTNGTWLVPAIAKWRAAPPADPQLLRDVEQTAWTMLRQELAESSPGLVLVDTRAYRHALEGLDFDILAFYLENPQIRALWANYAELAPVHGFRVFVRNRELSP
jgi:hypothetical protein